MCHKPATEANTCRTSAFTQHVQGRLHGIAWGALIVCSFIAVSFAARPDQTSIVQRAVICLPAAAGLLPMEWASESTDGTWLRSPASPLYAGQVVQRTAPMDGDGVDPIDRARYMRALGLVVGTLSLAGLSILLLSWLRERAWIHLRTEARDQIRQDLALLDATIHAEMKRYESLSRLGRRA